MGKTIRTNIGGSALAALLVVLAAVLTTLASAPPVVKLSGGNGGFGSASNELIEPTFGETSQSVLADLEAPKPERAPTIVVIDVKTGHQQVFSPYHCGFGYKTISPMSGGCIIHSLQIRPGDTVGGIAERLGHYSRWRELCYFAPYGVRYPGEFNPRLIKPGRGFRIGGCP